MKCPRRLIKNVTRHAIRAALVREAPLVPPGRLRRKVHKGTARKESALANRRAVFYKDFVYIVNGSFSALITVMSEEEYYAQKELNWKSIK